MKTKTAVSPKSGADRLEALFSDKRAVSIMVVVLGFLIGTILVAIVGKNPAGMYTAMLQTLTGLDVTRGIWNSRYIGEWLTASLPLILCGLSMGFAARTGLFNIGAEGQYIVGLTVAQFIAYIFPPIPVLHWAAAVAAAGIAGAFWGGLAGWMKAKFAVSEVVATIMLNYIAFFASRWSSMQIPGANTYRTPDFPQTARLKSVLLENLTNESRLNIGIWIAIACCVAYWYLIEKTRMGFELRATGLNKDAARASGIRVTRSLTTSMLVAGMFAGFAGAVVALGSFGYGRVLGGYDNYGFNGIAVALVGNSTGGGILVSGLLFGMLSSSQPLMQSRQIPKEITWIISGVVVVLISFRAAVKLILDARAKKAASLKKEEGNE